MSMPTFRRIQDIVKWYVYHKQNKRNFPIEKKVEFLEDVVDELVNLSIMLCEDIKVLEVGKESERKILVPTRITLSNEDIRAK